MLGLIEMNCHAAALFLSPRVVGEMYLKTLCDAKKSSLFLHIDGNEIYALPTSGIVEWGEC